MAHLQSLPLHSLHLPRSFRLDGYSSRHIRRHPDFKENESKKRKALKLIKAKYPLDFFTVPMNSRYGEDQFGQSKTSSKELDFQCTFFPAFGPVINPSSKQLQDNQTPPQTGKERRSFDRQSLIQRAKNRSESSRSQRPLQNPFRPIKKIIDCQNQILSFNSHSVKDESDIRLPILDFPRRPTERQIFSKR